MAKNEPVIIRASIRINEQETLLNRDTFRETALVRQASNELREQGPYDPSGIQITAHVFFGGNPMVQEAEWR